MKPKIILVSHNFNPGHYSHLVASRKLFSELGYEIFRRTHPDFNNRKGFNIDAKKITFLESISLTKKDIYFIWFPSIQVFFEALFLRLFSNINIVYVYHEPYKSISNFLNSGYSFTKSLIIQFKLFISLMIAKLSHKIVMPSDNALNAVKSKNFINLMKINLIYDKRVSSNIKCDRSYFSYIGAIAEDHGFEEFIKFIKKYCEKYANPKIKFLIASKDKLTQKHKMILKNPILKNHVDIKCGNSFTDEEIDNFFSQTVVAWNAYRRSMQSGILATSYMNSTPVIITNKNRSEFFQNKFNGIEISSSYDFNEILHAFNYIKENFEQLSHNCESSFNNFYFYKSAKEDYRKFFIEKSS